MRPKHVGKSHNVFSPKWNVFINTHPFSDNHGQEYFQTWSSGLDMALEALTSQQLRLPVQDQASQKLSIDSAMAPHLLEELLAVDEGEGIIVCFAAVV